MARMIYNIKIESDRIRAAFSRLRDTQQPGENSGTGSRTDVAIAVKAEIIKLLDEGYTAKQIADAMKNDTFSILPKTITQLTAPAKKKAKAEKKKVERGTEQSFGRATARRAEQPSANASTQQPATFARFAIPADEV